MLATGSSVYNQIYSDDVCLIPETKVLYKQAEAQVKAARTILRRRLTLRSHTHAGRKVDLKTTIRCAKTKIRQGEENMGYLEAQAKRILTKRHCELVNHTLWNKFYDEEEQDSIKIHFVAPVEYWSFYKCFSSQSVLFLTAEATGVPRLKRELMAHTDQGWNDAYQRHVMETVLPCFKDLESVVAQTCREGSEDEGVREKIVGSLSKLRKLVKEIAEAVHLGKVLTHDT